MALFSLPPKSKTVGKHAWPRGPPFVPAAPSALNNCYPKSNQQRCRLEIQSESPHSSGSLRHLSTCTPCLGSFLDFSQRMGCVGRGGSCPGRSRFKCSVLVFCKLETKTRWLSGKLHGVVFLLLMSPWVCIAPLAKACCFLP